MTLAAAPTTTVPTPAPGSTRASRPRVLSIAGTDPTGGAGIQADLKAFAAHGAYGMAVTTALVAQNTHGVRSAHVPGPAFLREQLDAVSDDVQVDAVKIGMVADEANAREIARWLDALVAAGEPGARPHVVLDPVMVATSGHRLLDDGAEQAVRDLATRADVVTPNLPELAVLVAEPVATTWNEALGQAGRLARAADVVVLLKGGHLAGERSPDALVAPPAGPDERPAVTVFDAERVDTPHTHGTGCSLSAALAALRPRRADWGEAVRDAKEWLTGALRAGAELRVGTGRGPVDHLHHSSLGARRFSDEAWDLVAPWRDEVETMPFVVRLADGTLPPEAFEHYLAQDAAYLVEYSRVLSRAAQLAPDPESQSFLASSSVTALEVETALHRDWLGRHAGLDREAIARVEPSPVTAAYTNHLHAAAAGSYAVALAALLPCFWLYAHVGDVLLRLAQSRTGSLDGHPYETWIATYADEGFQAATRQARALTDEAARWVSPAGRARMLRTFELSSMHEYLFFEQGLTRPGWPLPPRVG